MGWFLGSKKKRGKPRRRAGLVEHKPWDPKRTLAGLKALGVFALAVGLVIGWRYSERYLLEYARQRQAAPVTADQVELVDAPAWMNQDIREQVRSVAAAHIDPDPMDGKSLRRAAEALRDDPWVREVIQVARRSGGRVLVSARYRMPVAVIQGRDGYHLVDIQGVCLPGLYTLPQVDRLGLVLVTGVSSAPPANAGEVWPGEDVRAGLALVRLLADEPYVDKIRSFDVGQRDERGRLRLVLHTADGTVRWGLPPGQEHAIEPDAQVKLGWLRQLAQRDGALSTGGQIIDIYGPAVPGVRQP
jgi:hypothetical protein